MIEIHSEQNNTIKKYKSLFLKKYRDKYKLFITIGSKLTNETIKYFECESLLSTNTRWFKDKKTFNKILVNEKILKIFYKNKMNEPLIGIFKIPEANNTFKEGKILILDNIQDPINMGSILRDCTAFNVQNIFITSDSVCPYNYKVLKGTTNPKIYKKIVVLDRKSICNFLIKKEYEIITTSAQKGNWITKINKMSAVVIGNEGNGVHKRFLKISNKQIKIGISSELESLSASSAATIIIHQLFNSYD